jgi:uncharacterized protein (TIGR03790 family)
MKIPAIRIAQQSRSIAILATSSLLNCGKLLETIVVGHTVLPVKWLISSLLFWIAAGGVVAADSDAELTSRVIVVANRSSADSAKVAAKYAERRGIPKDNVIALPMSMAETITWREFIDTIHQPLQDELIRKGWIDAVASDLKDRFGRRRVVPSGHRISYLVVCRGVPLKIDHDANLYVPLPPLTDRGEFQTNAGAVDAELALLAAGNYPPAAFVPNPLFGKERPSVFDTAKVVKVSRLDGPSLGSALALIDAAVEGEKSGLIGRAYIDVGGPYPLGDQWFEEAAKLLEAENFDLTVDRRSETFSSVSRFDAPVLYFGWYAADLNGPFAQPDFRFPPGAVALHLHSYSARTLSSGHQGWTAPLVARGVTATVGNVFEPYLDYTHHPHLLLRALLKGQTWGDAVYFSLRGLSWQAMSIGDPLYRPFKVTFADQWTNRRELDPEKRAYVIGRELRRLQNGGQLPEAIRLARESLEESFSLPLAYAYLQLCEAAAESAEALATAQKLAERRPAQPHEIALLAEVAEALARLGKPEAAAQLIFRLVKEPSVGAERRVALLARAAKFAEMAGKAESPGHSPAVMPPSRGAKRL